MHAYLPLFAISKGLVGQLGFVVTLYSARFDKTDSLDSDRNGETLCLLIDLAQRVVKLATVTTVRISYTRRRASVLLLAELIRVVNMVVTQSEFREEIRLWRA
jgi:hypothetical protein